jgi:hypothetical protein
LDKSFEEKESDQQANQKLDPSFTKPDYFLESSRYKDAKILTAELVSSKITSFTFNEPKLIYSLNNLTPERQGTPSNICKADALPNKPIVFESLRKSSVDSDDDLCEHEDLIVPIFGATKSIGNL